VGREDQLEARFGGALPDETELGQRNRLRHRNGLQSGRRRGCREARRASWDGFVELFGEWEGRQKIAGEIEQASGGKALWLAPGARFNSAGGLSVAASLGVPLWQRIRDSHPDNAYRFSLSVGKAF
jgi:hypothetical protein